MCQRKRLQAASKLSKRLRKQLGSDVDPGKLQVFIDKALVKGR